MDLIEDELIEEYLDGELVRADRLRFEDTFLCAPQRRQKLSFARALRMRAEEAARARTAAQNRREHPRRQGFLDWFPAPHPALVGSLASILLVLAIGGSRLFFRMSDWKGRLAELQARQENWDAVESDLRAQLEKAQARAGQPVEQPGREQMAAQRWSLTLAAGVLRSAQSGQSYRIPRGGGGR